MANTLKCPALKHGVAVTSITEKFFYGMVQPCCQSANCEASMTPRNWPIEEKPAIQTFYDQEVLIPVGRPQNASNDYPKYGINSFDEIFNEHREWVNDDGSVDETVCSWCIDGANKLTTPRLDHNEYTPLDSNGMVIPQVLDTDPKKLVFLGPLLLESICNFSCYICGSGNSTQWASIAEPIKKDLENAKLSDDQDHLDKWYNVNHLDLNKSYTTKIKSVLFNTDMSSVKFVTLVGGEPLYGKMFLWFLELLDSKTDLSNVALSFNTNVSIFPSEKVLRLLCKFKELSVNLSIDGVGTLQETTRPGVSWKETDANIDKWIAFRNLRRKSKIVKHPRVNLAIGCTLSVLNVNKIGSILDYAIEKDICTVDDHHDDYHFPLVLTDVQFKPYLDINLIPIKMRENWLIDKSNYPDIYQGDIVDYNTKILNDTPSTKGAETCLAYLSIVGKATTTKFSDANPEIYECLQNLAIYRNEQSSS